MISRVKRQAAFFRSARGWFLLLLCLALLLEALGGTADPWVWVGWYFHADMSSWLLPTTSFSFAGYTWVFDWKDVRIVLSLLEIGLLGLGIALIIAARRWKHAVTFDWGTLRTPLLVFFACIAFGFAYGVLRGADATIALWEVRGFLMLALSYGLASVLLREKSHVDQAVWSVLIGASGLAVENIIRWAVYLQNAPVDDLAYDHIDSIILGFAIVLCLGLLVIGGTRAQRVFAAGALPVFLVTIEVMRRRAAFAVLAVGLIAFFLLLYRLRPRFTWKLVLPLAALVAVYLLISWNDSGPLGQPARAIRSVIAPDQRDVNSDLYRSIERLDIIANIKDAPLTGLGFGQPFTMYTPLPDLSFWAFWHYTTHNAILWVWMKDGAIGFGSLLWLLGAAAYEGSAAVDTQRERWAVLAALGRTLRRRRYGARSYGARRHQSERPQWRRTPASATLHDGRWRLAAHNVSGLDRARAAQGSGSLAMLVAAVCLVPMQVAFSYVDLGLTSERDLLLFGVALALIAHARTLWPKPSADDINMRERRQRAPISTRPRDLGRLLRDSVEADPSELETEPVAAAARGSSGPASG